MTDQNTFKACKTMLPTPYTSRYTIGTVSLTSYNVKKKLYDCGRAEIRQSGDWRRRTYDVSSIDQTYSKECGQEKDSVNKLECGSRAVSLVKEPVNVQENGAPLQDRE